MFFSLADSKLPFQNLLLSAWPEESPQTQQENYGAEEPVLPVTEDFHPVLQQLVVYVACCLLASDTSAPVHTAPSV